MSILPSPKQTYLTGARDSLLPVLLFLTVLGTWEFFTWYTDYPKSILPRPSAIFLAIVDNWGLLTSHIIPTASVALGGFVIATIMGLFLALLMSWSVLAKEALYPNIVGFQIVPKIAWAPLFVLWLGIEFESRLAFAVFISIFPIIISMTAGLRNTDPSLVKLCRSLTATKLQTLFLVRFPFSLPYLISAMKMSVTLAMIGVIVGEFITSREGLGFLILVAFGKLQTDLMLASVLFLCFVGLFFYSFIAFASYRLEVWFGNK
jgi:NitT/TauT family transport system permease protein